MDQNQNSTQHTPQHTTQSHMNAEQQNRVAGNVIIALIAGLILGFIAGSAWASHKTAMTGDDYNMSGASSTMMVGSSTDMDMNGASSTSMNGQTTASGSMANGTNSVTLSDQKAGNTVLFTNINLPVGEWVAVRDNFVGKPEYILGAAYFAAGSQSNIEMHISRATVPGTSYQIVLFKDSANHSFNYTSDNLVNGNGNPVAAVFTAQ
jgi:hypothetical protein